jgi:hypothetical protein
MVHHVSVVEVTVRDGDGAADVSSPVDARPAGARSDPDGIQALYSARTSVEERGVE